MRHTLREECSGLWPWTYKRGMFFWSGVSPSRKSAIRALLDARQEAAACALQMSKWLAA